MNYKELYDRVRSTNNKINQAEFNFMKRQLKEDIKNGTYDELILTLFEDYTKIRNGQLLKIFNYAEEILNTNLNDSIDDLIQAMESFFNYSKESLDMTDTFTDHNKTLEQRKIYNLDYNYSKSFVDEVNLILLAYHNGLSDKLKPNVIESKKKCAFDQITQECFKTMNFLFTNMATEYEHYIFSELLDLNKDVFKHNTAIHEELYNRIKQMKDDVEKQRIEDTMKKYEKPSYTDNYKKLNTILKSKDYVEVRQRGSHKIFSNGTHSIPIPQHNIGKGLFHQIRKEANL